MSQEPDWNLYRTFQAVLRQGSLSGAARMLGLTQPTVMRQVDALEAALGTELFVRTNRGLSPTAAAARLEPYAETLFQTAAQLLRAASPSQEISGTVRITAGDMVGTDYLPPILRGLRRSHPLLHLELSLSDAVVDLLQRQADVAVRMFEPTQKALVMRRVNTVEIGLYAHRDYLALRGTPGTPGDLARHDVIGFDTETPVTRAVTDPHPWLQRSVFALRTNSHTAQLATIRSGFGIGYTQSRIAERSPELVRVLKDDFAIEFGMWVVMHERLRTDPACRAVFDALAAALSEMP